MADNYRPDQILPHDDDNDGIQEYDNRLPRWWLGLFVFTIISGVWMFLQWHVMGDVTLAAIYDEEMTEAEAAYGDRGNLAPTDVLIDSNTVALGMELFFGHCAQCHGADGSGMIGPNLTDPVWIHGGTADAISHTIYYGVVEQGMEPWGRQLGAENVAFLAAYVHNLGGGL